MPVIVRITVEGVGEAISYLQSVDADLRGALQDTMSQFGSDSQDFMKEATPARKGTLRSGDALAQGDMQFTLSNVVYYAGWRNFGHNTPRGWHTRHGYRLAKKRSFVEGAHFYEKTTEYIKGEALQRVQAAVESAIGGG